MSAYGQSTTAGQIVQLNAPLLLSGGAAAAEQQEFFKAVTDPVGGSKKLRQKVRRADRRRDLRTAPIRLRSVRPTR